MHPERFTTSSNRGLSEKRYSKILKTSRTLSTTGIYSDRSIDTEFRVDFDDQSYPLTAESGLVPISTRMRRLLTGYARQFKLTPSAVNKLVSRGGLEPEAMQLADELPLVESYSTAAGGQRAPCCKKNEEDIWKLFTNVPISSVYRVPSHFIF